MPPEAWSGVETSEREDRTWSVWAPVWSGGGPTAARLRVDAADPVGDGLWEPWIVAVE